MAHNEDRGTRPGPARSGARRKHEGAALNRAAPPGEEGFDGEDRRIRTAPRSARGSRRFRGGLQGDGVTAAFPPLTRVD